MSPFGRRGAQIRRPGRPAGGTRIFALASCGAHEPPPGVDMSELVITLKRVYCDEVTDDFLEGLTDEFGFRLCAFDMAGDKSWSAEEIPMAGMVAVRCSHSTSS
jgi:hypothetical protein